VKGVSKVIFAAVSGLKNLLSSETVKNTIKKSAINEIHPPILVPYDRSFGTFLNASNFLNF